MRSAHLFFVWVLRRLGSRGKSRIQDSAPAYTLRDHAGARGGPLLAHASFFVLKEVCPLCVATYVAVIGIFVMSAGPARTDVALPGARCDLPAPTTLARSSSLLFLRRSLPGAFPRESSRPQRRPPCEKEAS